MVKFRFFAVDYAKSDRLLDRYLLLGLAISIFAACSSDYPSKSLSISMLGDRGGYRISNYRVLNHPYKKGAAQQGRYQVYLMDKAHHVIQKIGFGQLNVPSANKKDSEINFVIPLEPNLHQLAVYKLDGSSGHYRLEADDPVLSWTLPDSIRKGL